MRAGFARQLESTRREQWTCPLDYTRTTYEEVKAHAYEPYLFGGVQRPECSNCHKTEELWANFCQFKSHGPACTSWDKYRLVEGFVARAEEGAAGVEQMLTLTPCDLFQLLEGRTLWLLGDSLTQELQRAMQCFFYEFWDLETHDPLSLTTDPVALQAYSKLDTGWCAFLLRGTRICHLRSNYGHTMATDILPNLHRLGAAASDIALFNYGAWHNDESSMQGNASMLEAYLVDNLDRLPFLVWREVAPQHFDTPLGEYSCSGCPEATTPFVCKPVEGVTLRPDNQLASRDEEKRIILQGGWRNRITTPIMQRLGVPVLAIWNQSLPLWDYHHNYQERADCTHMCHPSAYQVWVFQFYQLLLKHRSQLPPVAQ